MKGIRLAIIASPASRGLLSLSFLVFVSVIIQGQTQSPTAADPSVVQSRIERARSLAAIGNFTAATSELEAVNSETTDDAARDVARILLMSVYLKQSNYTRADAMLEESFKARTAGNENTKRVYFALSGSLVNGVRSRLDRYREFGLNAASAELPAEARGDVDQLRVLLERVVEQARQIFDENNRADAKTRNMDAVALVEDAAAVRLSLARTNGERTRWQREVAEARQRLVSSEPRIASNRDAQPVRRSVAPAAAATTAPSPGANQNAVAATATPQPGDSNTTAQNSEAGAPRSINSGGTTPASPAPPQQSASSNGVASEKTAGERGNGNGSSTSKTSATPISVGSLLDRATQRVQPSYPQSARALGVSGVVTVYVVVNEGGQVESVERAVGHAILQRPATDAARRWKFRPTVIDGQPVRVAGYISFNFAL